MTVPSLDSLNLDCMNLSDLRETARALDTLARYAERKTQAMNYRSAGSISRALALETECTWIYKSLPADWRW